MGLLVSWQRKEGQSPGPIVLRAAAVVFRDKWGVSSCVNNQVTGGKCNFPVDDCYETSGITHFWNFEAVTIKESGH